jgi:citrate lyase beta subunit
VRHFRHLAPDVADGLFHRPPAAFDAAADRTTLAVALGATLYAPATRPRLTDDLARQAAVGVSSMVVCLEDAVADEAVEQAQSHAVRALRAHRESQRVRGYDDSDNDGPLLFMRVRTPEQITAIVTGLGDAADVLAGFVLPKFNGTHGSAFLDAVADSSVRAGRRLYAMPVLESREVIFRESRTEALLEIQQVLEKHRDQVLAVRIGATDLSAAFGLRRPPDVSVYEIAVVADAIGDIVNILGRADDSGYVVTGPVWEYIHAGERILKPLLRASPFADHGRSGEQMRDRLISAGLDGLIREVMLDQANGLTGKTVIHPSHVPAVHALSVVSHEELCDATDVLGPASAGGGVRASGYANKMNEVKPHRAWAQRILRRAEVFGVARPDVTFVDLLDAARHAQPQPA